MRKKRVALQEGLHNVSARLKEEGYDVVALDQGGLPIDVMVYSGGNQEYLAHNMTGRVEPSANNQFVKMINADEVGMDELVKLIDDIE